MRIKRGCRGGAATKHWRNYDLIKGSNPCNLIDIVTSIPVINPICLLSQIIGRRGVDKSNLKQIECSLHLSRIERNFRSQISTSDLFGTKLLILRTISYQIRLMFS